MHQKDFWISRTDFVERRLHDIVEKYLSEYQISDVDGDDLVGYLYKKGTRKYVEKPRLLEQDIEAGVRLLKNSVAHTEARFIMITKVCSCHCFVQTALIVRLIDVMSGKWSAAV